MMAIDESDKYCDVWESYYNQETLAFTSKRCSDLACMFKCDKRPEKHRKNCRCLSLGDKSWEIFE